MKQPPNPGSSARGKLILAGLPLYLLFLIVQMPAAWLAARIPADSPLQLGQVSGSPWRGSASRITWQMENAPDKESDKGRLQLGSLTWNWKPGEIWHGRLGFDFELGQGDGKLTGSLLLGRNGHSLKNVRGGLDAAVLGLASRPFGLLEPRGRLVLDIDDLYLGRKRIHGGARVDWQGARSGLIEAPLGNYHMQMNASPDGRRARITVQTLQGELAINGDGEYLPGKGLQGSLRLTPPQDERGKRYSSILSLLGRPDAGGTWLLALVPQ